MTLRQVSICIKHIDHRTHNKMAIDAKLHGFNIPFKRLASTSETILDPAQEERAAEAMREALEKKKREFKNRG